MLKWEDQILQFMRAGSKQLDFPPLSSYHRLIIHRLAQRFGLDHMAIDPGSSGHYLDPNANRCVLDCLCLSGGWAQSIPGAASVFKGSLFPPFPQTGPSS